MILILALPMLQSDGSNGSGTAPEAGGSAAGPAGTPPDISNMTPAEAAYRLFERVMGAKDSGNPAEAQRFLPMAIQAHDMARPLNVDQLYHLALLHQAGSDGASALTVAREALAIDANDLLALMAGSESARALGDSAVAREYAARFLEVFDAERAKSLERYTQHAPQLDSFRVTARSRAGR